MSAIASEYPVLLRYLGELRFAACLQCSKTQFSSWRKQAENLPEQLSVSYRSTPEIAELAELEYAMRKAFEASDALPGSRGKLHPSVSLLTFRQNTTSLWSALICDELPPRPYRLEQPQHLVIWRHKGNPRMRLLGEEEYLCMTALQRGRSQKPVANCYVAGWLDSNVVAGAVTSPAEK